VNQERQESSSFFAKKEPKKLLLIEPRGLQRLGLKESKVFCFFFSKKKSLLPVAQPRARRALFLLDNMPPHSIEVDLTV
jgi:hypothetical protein